MDKFKIDFFELCFLAEACIPPVPIARACFWFKICDEYYHELTDNERNRMFEWITKNQKFNTDNEDCRLFYARYNPKNQFKVTYFYEGKTDSVFCFRFNEKYHTSKTTHVADKYIKEAVLVERKSETSGIDREQATKTLQSNCKHDAGYITGIAGESSKCVTCGKSWN